MRRPRWVVNYNIISNSTWIGTGAEFFDDEGKAKARFDEIPTDIRPPGYTGPVCAGMRPYYHDYDRRRVGAAHWDEINEGRSIVDALGDMVL